MKNTFVSGINGIGNRVYCHQKSETDEELSLQQDNTV